MKRELLLKRKIRSLESLGEAISAMRNLSAHHFVGARQAVGPARTYREGIERMLSRVGASLPAGSGAAGLLVIGAEMGLCGGYNGQVVHEAEQRRAALGPGPTFCVGRRAATLLKRRRIELSRAYAGPTSLRGILPLLLPLAEDVLVKFADEDLASFDIVSSRFRGVGTKSTPATIRLLPIRPGAPEGQVRTRYVEPGDFARAAVREFLYITLYDLLLDALAAEHAARLSATEAAKAWLEERTERLGRQLVATRREASTQELVEVAAGASRRAPRG